MKNTVGLSLPEYSYNTSQTVLIVGAGLAGCAIAHALSKRGYQCKVYDQHQRIASATSALPAAVVRPAIRGEAFFRDYFAYAFELCCQSLNQELFTRCGSLEITDNSLPSEKIASSSLHNWVESVDATRASTLAGITLDCPAVHIKNAGFINPLKLCEHWLQHKAIEFYETTTVVAVNRTEFGWQLQSESGTVIDESQVVVLATAAHTKKFNVTAEIPLQMAGGQIDLFEHNGPQLQCVINGNGYLLPVDRGVWCGATHHPVDSWLDSFNKHDLCDYGVQDADTLANKLTAARLLPALSDAGPPLKSFASVRTFTPDRLPVLGAAHDSVWYRQHYADLKHGKPARCFPPAKFHQGLYLACGLGSRGATQALLIGELLSDLISGEWQTDSSASAALHHRLLHGIHPARFLLRALRRGK